VAAREARYDFFEKTLTKNKIPYLLTAHHADDQTETLLMNFIRGTGLEGLKGIEPMANRDGYTLLRPFLTEERAKILQYLSAQNISYREDSSNADPAFWRNKIRHQILPLVKTINPGINHSLTQMVEIVREELVEQEKSVRGLFKLCLLKQTQKEIQLSASKLYTLPLAQQRRVIRKAYSELKGDLRDISFDFVKNFMTNQLDCLYTAKQKIQARRIK
jgi:tRNA(Ile)-lysidine synthase